MFAWSDAAHICERSYESDSSMPAHAEVSDVVEEDHCGPASAVERLTQQSANQHIRASWFIHDGGTKTVIVATESLHAFRQGSVSQIRSAQNHDTRGLAACVWQHRLLERGERPRLDDVGGDGSR